MQFALFVVLRFCLFCFVVFFYLFFFARFLRPLLNATRRLLNRFCVSHFWFLVYLMTFRNCFRERIFKIGFTEHLAPAFSSLRLWLCFGLAFFSLLLCFLPFCSSRLSGIRFVIARNKSCCAPYRCHFMVQFH